MRIGKVWDQGNTMTPKPNNGFMKDLLATFRAEAEEHIQAVSSGLAEMREQPPAARHKELMEQMYRDVHSLKGAARAVHLEAVEAICQKMEDLFAAIRKEERPLTEELADVVRGTLGEVRRLIESGGQPGAGTSEILAKLKSHAGAIPDQATTVRPDVQTGKEAVSPQRSEPEAGAPAPQVQAFAETVRVSVQRLEAILRQSEELLRIELAANHRTGDMTALVERHGAWRQNWGRMAARLISDCRNEGTGGGDLLEMQNMLAQAGEDLAHFHADLKRMATALKTDGRSTSALLDHLLSDTKGVLMLPFSLLAQFLSRMAEDVCKPEGKKIQFKVSGENIEMDKRVLDEIKDPLIHLIRNCVDHGIESPEARKRAGKPDHGTITLALTQKEAGKAEILVEDDGRGVDCRKVKDSAVKAGVITPAEARTTADSDALRLILESGITTSSIITDLSGRGLGMSIVSQKVDQLGGQVFMDSNPGGGTRIRLLLPITLTTFRGILVRVGDGQYVLPGANVERAWRLNQADIQTIENREIIQFDGRPVSFLRLAHALDLAVSKNRDRRGWVPVVVIRSAGRRLALGVDEVVGEQEVLVKPLGPQLARVRNISGAAVLGSGRLVPVLNAADLVRPAPTRTGPKDKKPGLPAEGGRVQTVLVVEDSVTSRVLLKNILQSAGYEVTTAVDGIDALTSLRTKHADLVVSDIEMPRMNGFALTSRIREDAKLGETPIVLVTAKETREDKERGIEAGANAYIAKSSFDQANLLAVMESLL